MEASSSGNYGASLRVHPRLELPQLRRITPGPPAARTPPASPRSATAETPTGGRRGPCGASRVPSSSRHMEARADRPGGLARKRHDVGCATANAEGLGDYLGMTRGGLRRGPRSTGCRPGRRAGRRGGVRELRRITSRARTWGRWLNSRPWRSLTRLVGQETPSLFEAAPSDVQHALGGRQALRGTTAHHSGSTRGSNSPSYGASLRVHPRLELPQRPLDLPLPKRRRAGGAGLAGRAEFRALRGTWRQALARALRGEPSSELFQTIRGCSFQRRGWEGPAGSQTNTPLRSWTLDGSYQTSITFH